MRWGRSEVAWTASKQARVNGRVVDSDGQQARTIDLGEGEQRGAGVDAVRRGMWADGADRRIAAAEGEDKKASRADRCERLAERVREWRRWRGVCARVEIRVP